MDLSLCIAAHNEEHTIASTIESAIAACAGLSHEVLVCANACTDETARAVETAAASDPQIRLIETDRIGKANAWNLLFDAARAPHVVFLDADVVIDPDAIRLLLDRLVTDHRLIAAGARCIPVNRHGDFLSRVLYRPNETHGCLIGRLYVVDAPALRRRLRSFDLTGMDSSIIVEDLWLSLVIGADRWVIEPDARVYYLHPHWREARDIEIRNRCGVMQVARLYPKLHAAGCEPEVRRLRRWAATFRESMSMGRASRRILDFLIRKSWNLHARRLVRQAARTSDWLALWRTASSTKRPFVVPARMRHRG